MIQLGLSSGTSRLRVSEQQVSQTHRPTIHFSRMIEPWPVRAKRLCGATAIVRCETVMSKLVKPDFGYTPRACSHQEVDKIIGSDARQEREE